MIPYINTKKTKTKNVIGFSPSTRTATKKNKKEGNGQDGGARAEKTRRKLSRSPFRLFPPYALNKGTTSAYIIVAITAQRILF